MDDKSKQRLDRVSESLVKIAKSGRETAQRYVEISPGLDTWPSPRGPSPKITGVSAALADDIAFHNKNEAALRAAGKLEQAEEIARWIVRLEKARTRLG